MGDGWFKCATGIDWEPRGRCVAVVPRAWARDGSAVAPVLCDCIRFLGWSLRLDEAGVLEDSCEGEGEATAEFEGFVLEEGVLPMVDGRKERLVVA
jgi:hypothetical protein